MAVTQEELGRRISAARREVGLSQSELAERAGIERSALSRIEAGKRGVESIELFRLAEALGKEFGYFLRPQTELSVQFRAVEQTQPEVSHFLRQIEHMLDDYRFLLDLGLGSPETDRENTRAPHIPQFRVPPNQIWFRPDNPPLAEASYAAKDARAFLGLGSGPIDIFHLIEERHDLLSARFPWGPDGIDGCYVRSDETAVIAVNTDKSAGRQRFTAAHEYGHHLFDRNNALVIDENVLSRSKKPAEKRANAFAAELLAPVEAVRQLLGPDRDPAPEKITHLQWHFGLSYEATLWRLVDTGYLSRARREELATGFSAKNLAFRYGFGNLWRADQRLQGGIFLPPRLQRMAIAAYEAGKISFRRLADMLGRDDPDELRSELDQAQIRGPEMGPEDLKREAHAT